MAQGRNWLKTLFPASYKGVPFQTERDEEEGGRRIVTHEFPMRDVPFNEDLGEAKREYEVTAYVASDEVESDAAALLGVMAQTGPGILVLPTHGPLTVRCLQFRRSREKDRAGKIAIHAKFVREGASTALVSIASLANIVFAHADAMVTAVAVFAASQITVLGQPDFVVDAAASGLQNSSAALEAVREAEPVDPEVSGLQRNAIQALYDQVSDAVGSDMGVDGDAFASVVTIARALADGIDAAPAIAAFDQVQAQFADPIDNSPYRTPSSSNADRNTNAANLITRLAALTAYAEAIARLDIPDRQTAIRLRADAAEYFGGAMDAMSADDIDLYRATMDLMNSVTDLLSRTILNRAPLVSVSANMRLPSLWWAHRLYQDPTRSDELVDRNRVQHPAFMPPDFEALAI